MREAIGASWLMVIVITFIALFSAYLAFSINYSKAFRVKDGIVDRLEKHNGPNCGSSSSSSTHICKKGGSIGDIAEFLSEIGYSSEGNCTTILEKDYLEYVGVTGNVVEKHPGRNNNNYCIQKVPAYSPTGQLTSAYYKVVVFFSLSLPILNTGSVFHISGETINMYYPDDDYMD